MEKRKNVFHDEETLALVDEDGKTTGVGAPRERVHAEGLLHGASHVFICKRENGRLMVFLQRRSTNKDSFPGCLDISSAGHMEYGYDFAETARKELFEELGIRVETEDLKELFTQRVSLKNEFHGRIFLDNEINKVYWLNLNVDISSLSLQKSEVSEALWISADDVLRRLDARDPMYCMEPDETQKALTIIADLL